MDITTNIFISNDDRKLNNTSFCSLGSWLHATFLRKNYKWLCPKVLILFSKSRHFCKQPQISSQGMMVEKQTIPLVNALIHYSNILGEPQPCCAIRGCHATSFLKSVFYIANMQKSPNHKINGKNQCVLE